MSKEQKERNYYYMQQHRSVSEYLSLVKETRQKQIHVIWFCLYKILETANCFIVTESRSRVAGGWGQGQLEGGIKKVHELLEGDGYVHYLNYGDGFTGVCTCQKNVQNACVHL